MAKFTALLTPESIRQGIICSSKKTTLEFIARIMAERINADHSQQINAEENLDESLDENPNENLAEINELVCFENLFAREKMGCTAIGGGIAMPRARLPENIQWDRPIAVFLQLATAIDYDSIDKREVDLIFAMMIPENRCQEYSPILAELSGKLKDKSLGKQLRNAQSAEEIWQIFEYADAHSSEQSDEYSEVDEKH